MMASSAMDLERFAGRVALLTGAAGGLGSAMSEDLVDAGLIVVGVDVLAKPLKELADRLGGRRGKFHALEGDISKKEDLERVFRWVEDNLGGVSIMLNNAGIANAGRLADLEYEKMYETINTNVLGVVAAASKSIASMKKHDIKDGHIVNVSSILGHATSVTRTSLGFLPVTVYCATKHAVTGLSRSMRAELRTMQSQGFCIRVTNLCPGFVNTNIVSSIGKELVGKQSLMPADVARTVRFVLSSPPNVEISEISVQPSGEVW